MGLLEVKNLSFGYDNQIEYVFENISFQIDTVAHLIIYLTIFHMKLLMIRKRQLILLMI